MNPSIFLRHSLLRCFLVFALLNSAADAASLQVVRSFTGAANDGFTPAGGLVEGGDGAYYGTSQGGGPANLGTIFKVTPAGVVTIVKFLDETTGYSPTHGLYLHSDGNLYGSMRLGGAGQNGTAIRITPAGVVTRVASHSFQEGSDPSELTGGPDGNLYGVTRLNGQNNQGTLFRVNLGASTITTVANFNGVTGWNAYSGLTLGLDNKLYGTTSLGYPAGSTVSGSGNVFRYTVGGVLENVVTFPVNRSLGSELTAPLTRFTDGTFYGSSAGKGLGGPTDNGTIFKVTTAGVVTTLVTFNGTNGRAGTAKLIIGRDGNFYGTTPGGGTANKGTVFRMTPQGALTTLASFTGTNGMQPGGPMVEGEDGNLYGTTYQGGATNGGTVFRVIFGPQVITQTPIGTAQTVAILRANINSFGESATVGFEYGTTTALGSATPMVSAGTTNALTPVQATVSGLEANRTYFFRGVATSASGTRRGDILSLTTAPLPPVITIQPATSVRANTTTLNGTVNANGASTAVHFEYATDANFTSGLVSTPTVDAGSGSVAVPVTAPITGLVQGTVYYARLVAQNAGGTSNTATGSFTTNTPPTGGSLSVGHCRHRPGRWMQIGAFSWTDPNLPLTYEFFLDDVPFGPPSATASLQFPAPAVLGQHRVKLRRIRLFGRLHGVHDSLRFPTIRQPPGRP